MPAFYRKGLPEFLSDPDTNIIGCLTRAAQVAGFSMQRHTQTHAWQAEIEVLKTRLNCLASEACVATWQILLEYPIARRGKRIDVILIVDSRLVVLEFKCGAKEYSRDAIAQVEDYCLDLSDFHEQSRGRTIIPFVVATDANEIASPALMDTGCVEPTWCANARNLSVRLLESISRYRSRDDKPINPEQWERSNYLPTPTIIEAAQSLYAGQNVREITRCFAGIENLTRTTEFVVEAIEDARLRRRKRICFITGVPGSGKTLAGLNVVHNKMLHETDLGVFLSGNVPLVRVLTEALARDAAGRLSQSLQQSRRKVETFIQNVHRFIDAYYGSPNIPPDRVVVFDEAQRAWDAAQSARKFKRSFSEPEILLEIMDRQPDWAVIVALVGSGQEINRGEAGLSEWGRAIVARFNHWEVLVSPELKAGVHRSGPCLFPESPPGVSLSEEQSLHLSVNLRSYKAEMLSEFVDAILEPDAERAFDLSGRLGEFMIVQTRELIQAKDWLWKRQRGFRRIGLIASSGGRRLRAHGLDVTADLDVENWFLNDSRDVRSSHYLEIPATEFGIQGLELDWTGLCWDADLCPGGSDWNCRAFRGTQWQQVRDASTRRYSINKYRVLLTRAREGMVIWVPRGDPDDATRPPEVYDQVAEYLARCGIPYLR
jgi:hypothetical protein